MSTTFNLARIGLFATIAGATFVLFTAVADAETKKKDKKPARGKADAGQVADGSAPLAPKSESASPKVPSNASSSSASVSSPSVSDAGASGAVEAKTLDGGAKVFRFGEMEIEGRLRNPQLVYFLRRVRAEFAAGDLGHRSFMQELSETKNEPSF